MEDINDLSESELKKELKKLYKKMNDLDDDAMEDLDFDGKMIVERKNEDGEVVEAREASI